MLNRFRQMPATAIAAVLGCALMVSAAPAAAKEKPKKEETKKSTGVPVSKGFSPAVKKMGDAFTAKNAAGLQAAIAAGEGSASEPGDRYWLNFYKLQLGVMNKDRALQAPALDAMIDSGLTPPDIAGLYNFYSGNFAYGDKNYAKAIQRLEAAKAAGSVEPALAAMLMDSYLQTGQVDKGWTIAKAGIEAARAAGQRPSEELFVRPAQAFQKANRANEMLDVLTMRVQDYPNPATWRNTLYILLQQAGDDKDLQLDTLRLMSATNSMTQRAEYLEYAALATEAGYPGEVVAVIQRGQNGGVIPKTGDARFGPLLTSQTERANADKGPLMADAAKAPSATNLKATRGTADALVGIGEYTKAIPFYQAVASDPVAQYRLGVAQALAGQNDAAAASVAKVQGTRQRLAQLWAIHAKAKAAPVAAPAAAPAPAPAS